MLLHTPVFLASPSPFAGLFICGALRQRHSQGPHQRPPSEGRGEKTWRLCFSLLYSVLSTSSLLAFSPLPTPARSPVATRSVRWQESLGKGSLVTETTFHVCEDLSNPHWCHSMGENGTVRKVVFSPVKLLAYTGTGSDSRFHGFILTCCLSRLPSYLVAQLSPWRTYSRCSINIKQKIEWMNKQIISPGIMLCTLVIW